MKEYLDLVDKILTEGTEKDNRTGIKTLAISGYMLQHDLQKGFPLLTTKKMGIKTMAAELEFFIKGLTDKRWLEERGCYIWSNWCSPTKVPYGTDEETKKKMMEERDLGPLGYSWGWRNFGKAYQPIPHLKTKLDKNMDIQKSNDPLVGFQKEGKYGGYKVISYDGKGKYYTKRYTVKFFSSGFKKNNLSKKQIEDETVFDLYYPEICGVACLGDYENISGLTNEQIENLKNSWKQMIHRCYNKNHTAYCNYGKKSIYVVDRWLIFSEFLQDVTKLPGWGYKVKDWKNYHLDKDKSFKNYYSPDTCEWLSIEENNLYSSHTYWYRIISPTGEIYETYKLTEFCKEHDLKRKNIEASIQNDTNTSGGWNFIKQGKLKKNINQGVDQLKNIIETLKSNPLDRRMVCSAWNPEQLHQMALPPCHIAWHLVVIDNTLNLNWFQRSCDTMLGVPFNLSSYALLLMLLAKEAGLKPGVVSGMLSDVHIYENHIELARGQLKRLPHILPQLEIVVPDGEEFDIFKWEYTHLELKNYKSHDKIKYPIAV